MNLFDDTIIGISTALAQGAISIIRLSGDEAIDIAMSCFRGKNLKQAKPNTIHYGHIIDPKSKQVVDEVLVSIFKSPKSYTTEDVVEINCHGGLFVTNQIYELLVLNGARPAEPGEFTKRAFLSGRIDLTKAEAVMDVIEAENKAALRIATSALDGKISQFVRQKREMLLQTIATISVNIDYPEYDDVEELTNNDILPRLRQIKNELLDVLEYAKSAKLLKNGIRTAIIGRPNVGKSSLLNALLKENKAIVTDIPGTTRDVIEATVNLGSITLHLFDTAGIRSTSDLVEQIGVKRSYDELEKADLVLLVLDGSDDFTEEDARLFEMVKDRCHIVIINKNDLKTKCICKLDAISMNTKDTTSIAVLEQKIIETLSIHQLQNKDITYISNARQIEKLNLALKAIEEAIDTILVEQAIDFVDIYIRKAWLYLGEIIGETSTDSLLDELFSKFCLGK